MSLLLTIIIIIIIINVMYIIYILWYDALRMRYTPRYVFRRDLLLIRLKCIGALADLRFIDFML